MKRMKKMLSLLLAFTMTFSCLGNAAVAEAHMDTKPADGVTLSQPFDAGTGGSQNFRIPCLVALDDGTIVAACDARWTWAADAGGIDTIVSRSTDNGATWNYTFANYMGDNGNVANNKSTCFIDPAMATDGEKIYMIADLYPAGYAINSAAHTATPGVSLDEYGNLLLSADERTTYAYHLEQIENGTVESYYKIVENESGKTVNGYVIDAYFNIKSTKESGGTVDTNLFFENSPFEFLPTDYLYLTTSEDGGATWSIPSIINVRKPEEQSLLVGPGTGIVASTGRIIFTVYDFTYADGHSACIYSDDGGATWTRGESVANQTSEATVTEADGRLYMFTRHGGYYVSEDWGETWSSVKQPGVSYDLGTQLNCITYSKKIDGKTAIILSAPAGSSRRTDGKLFVALVQEDGSLSWEYEYEINKGAYAYSSLTELNDGSIGLLYEYAGSAITYTNIQLEDIIGKEASVASLYCANAEGTPVDSVNMKPGQAVTLNVNGANGLKVQATSNNELVSGALNGTTLTITAAEAITDLGQAEITVTDGIETVVVKVNVFAAENYKMVDLGIGETVTYVDETGNYADADLTKVDTKVATVTLVGREKDVQAGLETNTSGTSGADFAEDTMEVKDCLYTFTKSGENQYVISAVTADGKTVYLTARDQKGNYPCMVATEEPPVTDIDKITHADANDEFSLTAEGTLYFWNKTDKAFYFDRNGRKNGAPNVTAGNCWFELYRAAETQEELTASLTSPIPGYVKVTELTEIKDGGKYLIAHKGFDGAYYIMRPSASTSDKYAHIAKVLPETVSEKVALTDITIAGVAEGMTCATVGDITYYITVEDNTKTTVKQITLTKGETMGVVESVAQPEGNVITVTENTDAAPYAAVSELAEGKYLIGSSSHIILNVASGASPSGLTARKVDYMKDNLTDEMWTVKPVDGGYTIQDKDGKYININGTNVTLSDTAQTLTVTSQGSNLFSIGNGSQNLNNYSGAYNNIAAYGGVDGNSKWYFYQSTGSIITGTHCGTVALTIGTTDYEITVEHDCEWTVKTASTCTAKGEETGTCSMCNEKITREVTPVKHTYGEWTVEKAATCTTTGLKSRVCTSCQHATEERVIAKTGEHTYGEWTTVTESTCVVKGVEEKTCIAEGCDAKEQRTIAKKEHALSAWTVSKEATSTEKGEIGRQCTAEGCDYTETKIIVWKTERPADGITKDQPFAAGTGGSTNFRIPCLVALDDGTIVAACDARWTWAADAGGIDTIVSRSKDNGKTWQYTFANYLGDNGDVANRMSSCFIDPAMATDGKKIYMIADLYPAGYAINSAANTATPGVSLDGNGNLLLSADGRKTYAYHLEQIEDGSVKAYYKIVENESGKTVTGYMIDAYFNIKSTKESGGAINTNLFLEDSPFEFLPTDYLYLTTSEDGGATWSIPSIINVRKPEEQSLLVGPGTGIVTSTGRIIFTVYDFTYADGHSACIYSDDGGVTWTRGESVANQTSEATVTEADGRLYMFTRHGGYYVSEDWGETWSSVKQPDVSYDLGTQLNCITYSKKIDGKTAIILSAPAGSSRRTDGKLFVALVQADGSLSWEYEYEINKGAYAYSSLTELNDGSIGLLYEYAGSAIKYVNIPFTDIVGIWLENEAGKRVTSVDLKAGENATFTLGGTPDNALEIVSDNKAVTGTWNEEAATVTISADSAVTGLAEAVVTIADGSGSVITLNVTVTGTAVDTYEVVNLNVGETAEYKDVTGNYSDTDVSSVADVAQITMTGESVNLTETRVQLATGVGNFNGEIVNISNALYTFDNVSKTDASTFTCVPTAIANGTTVYLNQKGDTSKPNSTSSTTITVKMNNDGTFSFASEGSSKWLYFWYNNAGKLHFDRNSGLAAPSTSFKLYMASENAPADSPIPGYAQVTTLDGITEDGKYLIVHEGIVDNESIGHYLLYPYSGGSSFNHVAKATGEVPGSSFTDITIKAVAAGSKSIKIGDVTYFINVTEKVENVTIGKHEKFFVETETAPVIGEQSVVTMEANGATTPPYKGVSEIATGKYLMGNASHMIKNEVITTSTPSGLALERVNFNKDNLADNFWTVTVVEGGYTIQDASGKYININGQNVTLEDTAQTLKVAATGDGRFTVGNGSTYFNNWSGSGTKVGAYSGIDNNSKWYFYQPAAGYWFTAATEGTTSMLVGDVTYNIEVIACQHKNVELQGAVEVTCTVDGYTGDVKCTSCGATVAEGSVITATGHAYGAWIVTKEGSCTTEETKERTCTVCGDKENKTVSAAHSFGAWTETKAATCKEAGEETRTCSACGETETKEIAKLTAHSFGQWTETKAATCKEAGEERRTCSVCDKTETRATEKAEHTPGTEWKKDETNHWHVCTVDGCETVIDEAAHIWNAGVVTTEPTATEDGVRTFTCTVCGQTKTESIPATEEEPEVPAVDKAALVVAIEAAEAKDATKYTAESWATMQTALTAAKVVNDKADATQKEVDNAVTALNVAVEGLAEKPHEHQFGEWKETPATCTTTGSKVRVCACGQQDVITLPASGHKYDAGKITKAPTATKKGVKTYTCTVCKVTKKEDVKALGAPKKGTTFVVNKATYKITKAGLTGGTVTFVKTKSTAKSITIPKTVKSDGITYKVTEIAKNALKGNKKATKVTIESNVAKIGANAFDKCTKLKTFVIKTTKLTSKNVAKNAFKGVNVKATMTVPKAKVNAYKKLFKSKGLSTKVKIKK